MENLKGKILMVVAFEGFRDEEYAIPRIVFEEEGFQVEVASWQKGEAYGRFGKRAVVDFLLSEANPDNYKAIVFVGGEGAARFFKDPFALNLVKEAYNKDKVIGAICIAPSILANAGILQGKKATCFPSEKENLLQKGAIYTGEEIEIDGKIVTASGPLVAEQFGKTILNLLR